MTEPSTNVEDTEAQASVDPSTDQNATESTETRHRHERPTESGGEFSDGKPVFTYVGVEDGPTGPRKPHPLYQSGTFRTSGTAGDTVDQINEITPAFQIGRAQALVHGARALDPEDPTPPDLVVLPNNGARTEETAREALFTAARNVRENPVEIGGMTPARRAAAEEWDDEDNEQVPPSSLDPVNRNSGMLGEVHNPNGENTENPIL